MGWNQNQIENNKKQQFLESIEQKRQALILSNIEKTGKMEEGEDSLKEILTKDLNNVEEGGTDSSSSDSSSGDEFGTDDSSSDSDDFGTDDSSGGDDFGAAE